MKQTFTFENISCPYHLIIEQRKTITATVFPNQTVIVKAPQEADITHIDSFLQRKIRWILKQQRYFSKFRTQSPRKYMSGETFRYRGRSYKLLVRKTTKHPHVSLRYGTLIIFSDHPKEQLTNKKLLNQWYHQKAGKVFQERLKDCLSLFDYPTPPTLRIRKLKKRWGSYLPKKHQIILNQDLIQATKSQIDYVIIHELCHIKHKSHNRAFYTLLKAKVSNSEEIKEKLEHKLCST